MGSQYQEAETTLAFQHLHETLERTIEYTSSLFVLPRNRQEKLGAMEIGMEAREATNNIHDPQSAPKACRDPGHVFVCNASV
jgi:hypothetical protein